VTGRAAGGIAALCLVLTVMACRVEDEPGEAELGGADAPGFELQDLHGSTVTLEELRGKAVVLDFWATWCTPCVFQIPVLNAFHEQHGDRIEVIGIAVDAGGREVVAPFAAEHGIDYRVLLGDEGLAQRYGAPGFPALYVITPDGQIDSAHVGLVQEGALEASVRAALARTPPL
jgi:thiol-disulfide isomerase/thioredoxin